ncbi:uncharacterized protein [Watersipora subatra]|uniref:uncharacterized protein n=1 Tax=Watersipora subatra TaxID=2589382 RepID=UPI00355B07D9
MDLKIIVLLAGMMLGGSYAISCYKCLNCDDNDKVRFDCSTLFDTDSCYLLYTESTDDVYMLCGYEDLDSANFTNGCTTQYGVVICRCGTSYCNTDDLIRSYRNQTTSNITTEQRITTTEHKSTRIEQKSTTAEQKSATIEQKITTTEQHNSTALPSTSSAIFCFFALALLKLFS